MEPQPGFCSRRSRSIAAKAVFTAATLRRFMRNPHALRPCGLWRVLSVRGAARTGTCPHLPALRHDRLSDRTIGSAWEQWFWGDALANLIITPAIFYWLWLHAGMFAILLRTRWIEGALLTVGLILTSYLAFEADQGGGMGLAESRFYAPVPFLFWAAIRFGMRGASAAMVRYSPVSRWPQLCRPWDSFRSCHRTKRASHSSAFFSCEPRPSIWSPC